MDVACVVWAFSDSHFAWHSGQRRSVESHGELFFLSFFLSFFFFLVDLVFLSSSSLFFLRPLVSDAVFAGQMAGGWGAVS